MDSRLANAGLRKSTRAPHAGEHTLGVVTVNWFGAAVDVDVIFERDYPAAPPTDAQIDAFSQFMSRSGNLFTELEEQLFDHYQHEKEDSCLSPETIAELFPTIATPQDLSRLTRLTGILVSYYSGEWSSYVGLLAECHWDKEDGLGVKIVDGVPIEFGAQNIVI